MYLSAGKVDDAIPVLRALQNSSDPQVAMRAQQSLTEAQRMKEAIAAGGQFRSSNGMVVVERVTAQQPPDAQVPSEPTTKPETIASAVRTSGPPKFLKGKLVRVDCSAPPAAVLSVVSASKTWKMRIADSKHAIVIGADEFSCAWTNLKVALNYHETGDSEGSVMSIEIQ
jgi:hypothetical protein